MKRDAGDAKNAGARQFLTRPASPKPDQVGPKLPRSERKCIAIDLSDATFAALLMLVDTSKTGGGERGPDHSYKVFLEELVEIQLAERFQRVFNEPIGVFVDRYPGRIRGRGRSRGRARAASA